MSEDRAALWNAVRDALRFQRGGPPLEPVPRDAPLPASFAQQRIWFLERLQPASPLHNLAVALRLSGAFSAPGLEQGLSEMVRRHEVLRTTLRLIDGQLVQTIHSANPLTMPVTDVRTLDEATRRAETEAREPFDLKRPPLIRAHLFRLGDLEHLLVLTMHHLAFDGWSFNPFMRELCATYSASLPAPRLQYVDFAVWQRRRLDGEALAPLLDYWKRQLGGSLPVLRLPADRPRTDSGPRRGACQPVAVSREVTDALKRLSANEGVTPFMMLLAAFKTLLYRYTGEEDIIVGSPVANRNRAELESLIGLFVNTLALRTSLGGQPSFRELLARVRDVVLGAYSHQDMPFEMLVDALEVERRIDSSPVFQVMFGYQNVPRPDWELPGLRVEARNIDTGTAKFDVTLYMWETQEGFGGLLEYDADLFDAPAMSQFVGHFGRLLEEIAIRPDQSIATLPLLSSAERYWLLHERNDTAIDYPRDMTIHEVFEAQARRTPDAIALVFGDQETTYSDLDKRASQLASDLVRTGVRPGMLVEIPTESSPSLIVQMLAILKCGAAFVPQPGLAEPHCSASASAYGALAYVMPTSGSTGTPKGVCISHRAVLRLVKAANYASLTSGDVFLQIAPVAFDASTFEIWGALLNGARLVLPPTRRPSLKEISEAICRNHVSVLFLTSALFELFVDTHLAELMTVRQLLVGGDVLSVPHAERFLKQARPGQLIHCYGPTENTTFTSFYPLMSGQRFNGGTIPIGRPVSNTQIYVLDGLQQVVPIGVVGEAYLGGDGLMRGYLDDEDLTRERLIPNPFSDQAGTFLYRTGDFVRYRRDGNLEFIGRTDDQVKIRGFRVEPGAVEVVLSRSPLVKRVCVVARNKRLVAYVVAESVERSPSELISIIRGFARERLPHYLVPSAFVLLETLPLKSNGKVDRSALPPPDDQTGVEGGPPRDEMERLVSDAFARALGAQSIGRDDSFFDRGGDSLLALNLFALLENTLNRNLPLVSLFEHQTVARFAAFLRTLDSLEPACSPDASVSGPRVVEIKRGQSKMPFFLVPGGTGGMAEMMMYARLMRNLNRDQAVYGLLGSRHATVQERAASYIHQMRMVQTNGPYALGGECVGGIVAFEMAQQLVAQGEEIALLLLMDTWRPIDADAKPLAMLKSKWSISRVGFSNLTRLLRNENWFHVAVRLKQKTALWLRAVQHIGQTLQYRPKVYPGRITLLVSSDNDRKGLSDNWRDLSLGGLVVHTVPGDHESYIRQTPEVAAERLSASLDACDVPPPQRKNSGPTIDPVTFEKMRRIVPHLQAGGRAMPLPQEVAFKLTNRCDLRCIHCYQWNETGYHHRLTKERHGDLELSIVARVLEATRAVKSNVYLWGGEPLVYQDWEGLVDLLANDLRWTSMCTNGTLIEKRLESLVRISSHLEVSVSIDGFEKEHDSLRGRGTFRRTMNGLLLLVEQKKKNAFLGEITVNCVITDAMVSRMFEFVQFLEEQGVETVYVSFPWYISEETSAKMDRYYAEHFSWKLGEGKPSWHSYNFRLDPNLVDQLNAEVARIDAAKWRLKLRYNPRLDADDMRPFIMGSDKPAQNKTRCHAIQTRMDIFPNGDVVSCKFFPEFRIGNLKDEGLAGIWTGERFQQVRQTILQCGLMPVCAKCNLLYTRGT